MHIFALTFTPAMLLMPIVAASCVRTRIETGGDAELARTRMIRLAIATVIALAIFAGLYATIGRFAVHAWPLFFPLFFGFAMPVIAAKNPDTVSVHPRDPRTVRSAALVNRVHTSPLRAWHWAIVWLFPASALALVAIGLLLASRSDGGLTGERLGLSLGMLLIWIPLVALLPVLIRMVLREPEPLDAAGSSTLMDAYARHRNFKVWGFYWLFGIAMNLNICAITVPVAWGGTDATLGVLGTAGGVSIGIGGAVLGTIASLQRVRITRALRELNHRESSSTPRTT